MTQLLSASQLAAVKAALSDVVDTFYVTQITYVKRAVVEDTYGEAAVVTPTEYTIRCKMDYSVGHGGRYGDIENTNEGKVQHTTWHVRLWKDDVTTAGFTIDPEQDSIIFEGKEYRFNFESEGSTFSNLGVLFYEMEIHYE
jgi:hypothetical protein